MCKHTNKQYQSKDKAFLRERRIERRNKHEALVQANKYDRRAERHQHN